MKPHKYSEYGQMKDLVQTLNLMNSFLILLVMSYMGSQLKILRISWYSSMKPFQTNLKLVIKKFFCSWHESFPGVEYSSNYLVLSVMSKYISSYNLMSIMFEFYIHFFNQIKCDILIIVYI